MKNASLEGWLQLTGFPLRIQLDASYSEWYQATNHRGKPSSKVRFGRWHFVTSSLSTEAYELLMQLMLSATAVTDAHASYFRSDGQGQFITVWGTNCTVCHLHSHFDATGMQGSQPGWTVYFSLTAEEMGRTSGTAGAFLMPAPSNYAYNGPVAVAKPVVMINTPKSNGSDCTESLRQNLQNQVKKNCKSGKQACLITDNCPTLEQTMNTLNACIAARTKINMTCFKGGDAGHKEQIIHKINGLIKCQGYYFSKCHKPQETSPAPQNNPTAPNIPKEIPLTIGGIGLFILYLLSGALRPGPI